LRLAHKKSSQEIAHLSHRRAALSDGERTWHIEPILVSLADTLHRFIASVPPSSVQDDFVERARRALPKADAQMTEHAQQIVVGATTAVLRP
jgi:hypothetical protein